MPHAQNQCRLNGRIYVWDTTQKFSLANRSVPLPPFFKEEDTSAVVQDLFWLLSGKDTIDDLKDKDDFIARNTCVKPGDVRSFIETLIELGLMKPEAVAIDPQAFCDDVGLGSFGKNPGTFLRHWALTEISVAFPTMKRTVSEIAPDLSKRFDDAYDGLAPEEQKSMPRDIFKIHQSYSAVDQLSDLAVALKKRKTNCPLLVTFVNPEFYPDEDFTPEDNILMKRSPHRPTELMFRCRIEKAPEGEKDKLHMTVYVDEQEGTKQAPSIALKYAVFAHLLALEADMDASELTIHAAASWIDENSTHPLMLQRRPKYPPFELRIDEGISSMYDVERKHIAFITKKENS